MGKGDVADGRLQGFLISHGPDKARIRIFENIHHSIHERNARP